MAGSDFKRLSSTSDSIFHSPGLLERYIRLSFVVWLHIACALGIIGTIVGLITFLIPGKVSWVVLSDRPVETILDKVLFTAGACFFAVVGTMGLIVRYRRRNPQSPKTPN
jgi:hypothetical protein